MSDVAVKKIFRSRQPVTHEGRTGYLDFWTKDMSRALAETEKDSTRIFEEFSYAQICELPPGPRAKAEAAWLAAFDKLD